MAGPIFSTFPCLETSFCPSSKVLSGGTYSSQNGKIVPNRLKNEPGFLLYIILFSTISSDIQWNFVIDIRRKILLRTEDMAPHTNPPTDFCTCFDDFRENCVLY